MITITLGTPRGTAARTVEMAWCEVDGRRYEAESTTGAIHALCRLLVASGVPDQPWQVPGRIKGGSIAWMAARMVADTDEGIRTMGWKPHPKLSGGGQQGGAGDPDGGTPPPEAA